MADGKKRTLLKVKEDSRIEGGKKVQRIYSAKVGGQDIGKVIAPNMTGAKKKFLSIARALLK